MFKLFTLLFDPSTLDSVLDAFDHLTDKVRDVTNTLRENGHLNLLIAAILFVIAAIAAAIIKLKEIVSSYIGHSYGEDYEVVEGSSEFQSSEFLNTAVGGQAVITSGYGVQRSTHVHHGVDLRAAIGSPVYSPITGVVTKVVSTLDGDAGGRRVYVSNDKFEVRVMHLSSTSVTQGQKVTKGQKLGTAGTSGKKENSYSPHLHLEVLDVSTHNYINPASLQQRLPQFSQGASSQVTQSLSSRAMAKSTRGRTATFTQDSENLAYYFMEQLSLSLEQSCGLVGNLIHESQLNPYAFNSAGGGLGAGGLAQWRGARLISYKNRYGRYPHQDPIILHHAEYIVYEMKTGYKRCLASLQHSPNLYTACVVVNSQYERSGSSVTPRYDAAYSLYMRLRRPTPSSNLGTTKTTHKYNRN